MQKKENEKPWYIKILCIHITYASQWMLALKGSKSYSKQRSVCFSLIWKRTFFASKPISTQTVGKSQLCIKRIWKQCVDSGDTPTQNLEKGWRSAPLLHKTMAVFSAGLFRERKRNLVKGWFLLVSPKSGGKNIHLSPFLSPEGHLLLISMECFGQGGHSDHQKYLPHEVTN